MDTSVIIALIILAGMMFLFFTELLPIAVTTLLGVLCFAFFGIVSFADIFAGFGNDIVLLIAGSMIVGGALFETGMAAYLGSFLLKTCGGSEKKFLIAIIITSALVSFFLSNTATMAMFLPIIATAAAASKGNIKAKNLVMATGFAVLAGGNCTLVGTTPQMIAQGLLLESGHAGMNLFSLAYTGIPKVLLLLFYFATWGYVLQNRRFDFPDRLVSENVTTASLAPSKAKMWISFAILLFCVIGFLTKLWTLGAVSITGGLLCIVTRCLTQEQAFRHIDLTPIVIGACAIGMSKGLTASGAGDFIAGQVMALTSSTPNVWLLVSALVALSILMGNIISHTATVSLLVPITIIIGQATGLSVYNLVFCIISGVNICYMSPISTPPNIMGLVAGYRFTDYLRVGLPLTIVSYIVTVVLCVLMF